MQRLLLTLATASLAVVAACSDEPAPTAEAQPAMAWTDPVIETYDKDGVTVDIFEKGTGTAAQKYDQVSVHYTGWIRNSQNVFDSSAFGGAPISFALGTHQMIAGWDKGLEGMTVGTRARLHIPWKFAYGKAGRAPAIPGEADLVFDVELVKIR